MPQHYQATALKAVSSLRLYVLKGVLHGVLPDGLFRTTWDCVLVVLIMYTSINLPFQLAFYDTLPVGSPWARINLAIDCFFLVDILYAAFFTSPTTALVTAHAGALTGSL